MATVEQPNSEWGWDDKDSWMNLASYGDHENWSYQRWAWEFMTRSPQYAELNSRRGLLDPLKWAGVGLAVQLGRPKELSANGQESKVRYWLPELVSSFESCRDIEGTVAQIPLEYGQVAVVIDLKQTVNAGQAAFDAMLGDARARLLQELNWYKNDMRSIGIRVPIIEKPRRLSLLFRLRLCDALQAQATEEQIIRNLYPERCFDSILPQGRALTDLREDIKEDTKVSSEYLDGGYLALVPLAHRQDKSAFKK